MMIMTIIIFLFLCNCNQFNPKWNRTEPSRQALPFPTFYCLMYSHSSLQIADYLFIVGAFRLSNLCSVFEIFRIMELEIKVFGFSIFAPVEINFGGQKRVFRREFKRGAESVSMKPIKALPDYAFWCNEIAANTPESDALHSIPYKYLLTE